MNSFSKQQNIFNRLRPALVTIETSHSEAFFEQHISAVLMQTLSRTIVFFYLHEECLKWSLLYKFGPDILLDGVLLTILVLQSFCVSTTYKLDNTITMATSVIQFALRKVTWLTVKPLPVKKLLLLTLDTGNKIFGFLIQYCRVPKNGLPKNGQAGIFLKIRTTPGWKIEFRTTRKQRLLWRRLLQRHCWLRNDSTSTGRNISATSPAAWHTLRARAT